MKLIAFYLPQFHTFPENDEWWEKDFTEWTNVKRAMKRYSWQYQPRIPYKNNYYNLNDDFEATMKWQIEIAKRGGVYGFCFYHYWFKNGKRLLEKPVERFLENENLDINFCLSWANEPWTRTWDGKQHDILMPQEYGDVDEWKDHCRLPRYLTNPGQRRSEWDMAGSDGISRVSAVFRGKLLLTNKMRII